MNDTPSQNQAASAQTQSGSPDFQTRLHDIVDSHLPDHHHGEVSAAKLREILRDLINAMPLK